MSQPPLLPEVVFARVVRTASFNGTGAFILGTCFALIMALAHEAPLATVGVLAAGAGAIELHGAGSLKRGDPAGMGWLIAAQPLMLITILGYCTLRVTQFTMPEIPANLREMADFSARQLDMTVEEYFRFVNRFTMQLLALAAVIYQGGLLRYYLRRREAVRQALTVE